ncbi:MAG: tetratricopeptide repeat protein [Ignavibacteria bacterium]|nr:tetratricopeptide repeat protein [Ignavibacteria bacterium]
MTEDELQQALIKAYRSNDRGDYREAEHYAAYVLEQALKSTSTELPDRETFQARALLTIATSYGQRLMFDTALEYALKALAIAEEFKLESVLTLNWNILGNIHYHFGNYAKTLEYFSRSLEKLEDINDRPGVVSILGNIGSVYRRLGSFDKALEFYSRSLVLTEEIGYTSNLAHLHSNIAEIYLSMNSFDKALEYFSKALGMFEAIDERARMAMTLGHIGETYYELGDYSLALEYLKRSIALSEELGDKKQFGFAWTAIGRALHALEEKEEAREYFQRALGIRHEELSVNQRVPQTLIDIGILQADLGYLEPALENLYQGLTLAEELGEKLHTCSAHHELYKIQNMMGNFETALRHFEQYHTLDKEILSEEATQKAALLEQQKLIAQREKEIELAKAAAAVTLSTTTTLLHRVLPESIASRMIAGEADIADYFPLVTILFADIVGFTPIASQMPAQKVIRFLNYITGTFDVDYEKTRLRKIKTIGDGYMAVAGAPLPCDDHAERMAAAALEMLEVIELPEEFREYIAAGTEFSIRIGLHSGSVVGGVIGEDRFVYDIYSDSVNTAARMESHGKPDKIHVSHDFYNHLQNRLAGTNTMSHGLVFEHRGEMDIKGKGMMNTYFLEKNNDQ